MKLFLWDTWTSSCLKTVSVVVFLHCKFFDVSATALLEPPRNTGWKPPLFVLATCACKFNSSESYVAVVRLINTPSCCLFVLTTLCVDSLCMGGTRIYATPVRGWHSLYLRPGNVQVSTVPCALARQVHVVKAYIDAYLNPTRCIYWSCIKISVKDRWKPVMDK